MVLRMVIVEKWILRRRIIKTKFININIKIIKANLIQKPKFKEKQTILRKILGPRIINKESKHNGSAWPAQTTGR